MTFITKRRLASLVSASAIVATLAVAAVPAATLAARRRHRPGSSATAIDLTVRTSDRRDASPATLDATGCDIGVYNPTSVSRTLTSTAREYFGVVVDGVPTST